MCGLFYLRSCAGGTKTGLGNFEFFGIFGNCGGGWSGLSESEKFLDFWVFGVKTKFFEFFGKFEFFGFQKGWRYELILY